LTHFLHFQTGLSLTTARMSLSYPGYRSTSPWSTSRRTLSTREISSPSCLSLYDLFMTWRISSVTSCLIRTCPLIAGASLMLQARVEPLASRTWCVYSVVPLVVFGPKTTLCDGNILGESSRKIHKMDCSWHFCGRSLTRSVFEVAEFAEPFSDKTPHGEAKR